MYVNLLNHSLIVSNQLAAITRVLLFFRSELDLTSCSCVNVLFQVDSDKNSSQKKPTRNKEPWTFEGRIETDFSRVFSVQKMCSS